MGCGALCGDTTTADSIASHRSKQAFGKLIAQLQANQQLLHSVEYSSFFKDYHQEPRLFQLRNKPKLTKNQQTNHYLLTKWKLLLLGLDKNDATYCECVGDTSNQCDIGVSGQKGNSQIFFHECFVQIQKDITRTFDVTTTQAKRLQFQNVLKRIANHFPKMGYTQGINFIVKYLIIIGYSEMESYQIFVHLATNKRYLLLGLYEDGFPLYNIFIVIFENLLKRLNSRLYQHLYEQLCIDPSMWVCKWFMTFYVYSFPLELIKYVLDMVILVGNLGLIKFAISLVQELQQVILEISQLSDLDSFLSSLKDLQCFNHHIDLGKLLSKAYSIDIYISDFENVQETNHFYGVLMKNLFRASQDKNSSQGYQVDYAQQSEKMLLSWRKSLIADRTTFLAIHQNIQLQIQSAKSLLHKDNAQNGEQILQSIPQFPLGERNDLSLQSENVAIQQQQKVQYSINQIRDKDDEQNQSTKSKYIHKSKKSNTLDLDGLDKIEFSRKGLNHSNSLERNASNKAQREQASEPKLNSSNINKSNSPSIIQQVIIKKQQSFQNVSVRSKQPSNKSNSKNMNRLQLPPKNSRICGCKTKTEQNKLPSALQNKQKEQAKEQYSDKDSVNSNLSHSSQNIDSVQQIDTHRQRREAHNNFMINSHGPVIQYTKEAHTAEGRSQPDIEVMVLQFKKKKKTRVNLPFIADKPANENPLRNQWAHDEQSIQSINQIDKLSQVHSHCSQGGNQYEIESIR